jgi:hypothetical protein
MTDGGIETAKGPTAAASAMQAVQAQLVKQAKPATAHARFYGAFAHRILRHFLYDDYRRVMFNPAPGK